jgi:exosortase
MGTGTQSSMFSTQMAPQPIDTKELMAVAPRNAWWRDSRLGWGIALVSLALFSYGPTLIQLAGRWWKEADYSHGFVVPLFSAYLLWFRRDLLSSGTRGNWWGGCGLFAAAGALRFSAAFYLLPLMDAVSILVTLSAVCVMVGGFRMLAWAAPSILFLVFMIPLPGALATQLSGPLQRVATVASTFLLQTLGVPAVSQGSVIWLSAGKLGVVEACSGLRMLMVVLAITMGAAMLLRRPIWERVFVAASALVIGVITNVIRITLTGVVHEFISPKVAESLFHDFAGILMMPVAVVLLCLELVLLSKLLTVPTRHGPILVRN